jgi:hypothetical protein
VGQRFIGFSKKPAGQCVIVAAFPSSAPPIALMQFENVLTPSIPTAVFLDGLPEGFVDQRF